MLSVISNHCHFCLFAIDVSIGVPVITIMVSVGRIAIISIIPGFGLGLRVGLRSGLRFGVSRSLSEITVGVSVVSVITVGMSVISVVESGVSLGLGLRFGLSGSLSNKVAVIVRMGIIGIGVSGVVIPIRIQESGISFALGFGKSFGLRGSEGQGQQSSEHNLKS